MARFRESLQNALKKEIASRALDVGYKDRALWPDKFGEDSYDACLAFCYQCKTFNEANRGIDSIAQKDYLDWATWHWYDTRQKGQPLITWKSRRMVYSWWDRCLGLWDAGLKVCSTQLAAKTYEGDSGSQAFIWRYWFIYNQLRQDHPEWNLPKPMTGGNPLRYEIENLILANGSKFEAINSEKESFRGSGATRAISEELSSYLNVNGVWAQQNFVTKGKPGEVGGHPVAIANTSPNIQWQELKAPCFVDPEWPEPPPGCEAWETAQGVRVLKIHYSADPEKDALWVAENRKGIPDDEWDREMELDETIEDGLPVFPNYDDEVHCPLAFQMRRIPIFSGSTYFGAWDCGQTLIPAFVLFQVTPDEKQVHALLEVGSKGNESMAEFAPRVRERLLMLFPDIMDRIHHCGDATVKTKSGTDKRSARDEARKWGFNIVPMSNEFELRRSAGNDILIRQTSSGKPGFLIDGTLCPTLRKALGGKYKFQQRAADEGKEQAAQVVLRPLKNLYSHLGDAFGYGSAKVRMFIEGKATRPSPRDSNRGMRKKTRRMRLQASDYVER